MTTGQSAGDPIAALKIELGAIEGADYVIDRTIEALHLRGDALTSLGGSLKAARALADLGFFFIRAGHVETAGRIYEWAGREARGYLARMDAAAARAGRGAYALTADQVAQARAGGLAAAIWAGLGVATGDGDEQKQAENGPLDSTAAT